MSWKYYRHRVTILNMVTYSTSYKYVVYALPEDVIHDLNLDNTYLVRVLARYLRFTHPLQIEPNVDAPIETWTQNNLAPYPPIVLGTDEDLTSVMLDEIMSLNKSTKPKIKLILDLPKEVADV